MLEKLVLSLSTVALATTVGGGYVWAQGGFETPDASSELAPVARTDAPDVAAGDPQVPTGYGVLGSTAPLMGPHAVSVPTGAADPTDSDAAPPAPAATPSRAASQAPSVQSEGSAAPAVGTSSGAVTTPATGLPAGTLPAGGVSTWGRPDAAAGATSALPVAPPSTGVSTTPALPAATTAATPGPSGGGPSFGLATFNLLGSSHTPPGGTRASGPDRMVGALQVLAQHGTSVVGFQEMQQSQHVAFEKLATGWQSYPSTATARRPKQDTVAWRSDTWTLVSARTVLSPAWLGTLQPMPYVLLRHRATGRTVYVSTFHNTVGTRAADQASREDATRRQVALVQQLAATGVPQLLTGDMNERDTWFCRITAATGLRSATGGTNGAAGCRPSRPSGIDWILGSTGISFSGTQRDRSDLVRSVTDHPVLVTQVSLPR